MGKKKTRFYLLAIIPLIIIAGFLGWFITQIFEGGRPVVSIEPLPEFLSGEVTFTLKISDVKRGLKKLKVNLEKEGREIILLEKKFPFEGFLNQGGIQIHEQEIVVDPSGLNLTQGQIDLRVSVWDYSRRGGGDGNMAVVAHRMIVDTIPPAIRAISRMHNVNRGGACLTVYQASSDVIQSGVFVDEVFFPGYPIDEESQKGIHICYFSLPYNAGLDPSIFLWAKDRAENSSKTSFYYHIREKRFDFEKLNITDEFLKRVLGYFTFYPMDAGMSEIEKYIEINNDLRKESHEVFYQLREETAPEKLWEGTWVRQKNAATMARFADHRDYYYQGEKVDEQVHLGVDLASLANSPVQATNSGRVVFAERNGIYGLAVVVDHGQGLSSLYGHLSMISVKPGQEVKKGDIVGHTGQTGLAGGDHLHFGIMVSGIPVDPVEWWDSHWIEDNITKKLDLLKELEKSL
ncbi:MAG: M23 family metallopeptidase [Deltaproteobacteria bacterium]|nr:M23 family metallopeptidase [Deltaproteobacteria bacterium]